MAPKIENLQDLFVHQGREMYDASKQIQKELPKIQNRVSDLVLKQVIEREINAAKVQGKRIEEAFSELNETPSGKTNDYSRAIIDRTKKLIEDCQDPEVCDAAIINAVQQINHSNIAGLGSLSSYAREIGKENIAKSIHNTVEDEKNIDFELTKIAEKDINKKAVDAVARNK